MIAPPPLASNNNSNTSNNNNNNINNNKNNNNNNKSDSDSDSSDWDDDDDFTSRKISINIKPINQISQQAKISSSVDELRATVGTWKSLANINLVKPNSRRHHQSNLQLHDQPLVAPPNNEHQNKQHQSQPQPQQQQQQQPKLQSPPSFDRPFATSTRLPVAFAVQECYDLKQLQALNQIGSTSNGQLAGHIRMAVPPCLADPMSPFDEQDLEFSLASDGPLCRLQVNGNFVERLESNSNIGGHQSFRINMQAVRNFARQRDHMDSARKYILLPELIRYYTYFDATASKLVANNGGALTGKTLSGTHIILRNPNSFHLARQKYEVRATISDLMAP